LVFNRGGSTLESIRESKAGDDTVEVIGTTTKLQVKLDADRRRRS